MQVLLTRITWYSDACSAFKVNEYEADELKSEALSLKFSSVNQPLFEFIMFFIICMLFLLTSVILWLVHSYKFSHPILGELKINDTKIGLSF